MMEVIDTYLYNDAHGVLQYKKLRFEDKSFTYQMPDGSSKITCDRVLYNMERFAGARSRGELIVIVEGEKDVHTLHDHGITATCFGGANDYNPKLAHEFNGLDVIIIPDLDNPGYAHMMEVYEGIKHFTESIHIVDLAIDTDLESKADITDFVERYPDKAQSLMAELDERKQVMDDVLYDTYYIQAKQLFNGFRPYTKISKEDLPIMDKDIFPRVIREMCEEVSRCIEVPFDMAAWAIMGILSICFTRSFYVERKSGHKEILAIWAIIISEAGTRKSITFSTLIEPLNAWVIKYNEQGAEQRIMKSVELDAMKEQKKSIQSDIRKDRTNTALITELQALEMKMLNTKPPQPLKLTTLDITPENLVELMAQQKDTMALVSPDGGGPFKQMKGQYNSGISNLEVYLSGHAGDQYERDRVGQPSTLVRQAKLCMVLCVQEVVMQSVISNIEMQNRGMNGRYLPCFCPDNVGHREVDLKPVDPHMYGMYEQCIHRALSMSIEQEEMQRICFDDAANDVWLEFAQDIETRQGKTGDLYQMRDFASKLAGTAMRFAGILHLCQYSHKDTISAEYMHNACALAEYALEHMKALVSLKENDENAPEAKALIQIFKDNNARRFTMQEVCDWTNHDQRFCSDGVLDKALITLSKRKYLEKIDGNYMVHPQVFEG